MDSWIVSRQNQIYLLKVSLIYFYNIYFQFSKYYTKIIFFSYRSNFDQCKESQINSLILEILVSYLTTCIKITSKTNKLSSKKVYKCTIF